VLVRNWAQGDDNTLLYNYYIIQYWTLQIILGLTRSRLVCIILICYNYIIYINIYYIIYIHKRFISLLELRFNYTESKCVNFKWNIFVQWLRIEMGFSGRVREIWNTHFFFTKYNFLVILLFTCPIECEFFKHQSVFSKLDLWMDLICLSNSDLLCFNHMILNPKLTIVTNFNEVKSWW